MYFAKYIRIRLARENGRAVWVERRELGSVSKVGEVGFTARAWPQQPGQPSHFRGVGLGGVIGGEGAGGLCVDNPVGGRKEDGRSGLSGEGLRGRERLGTRGSY
jgi:hypothetical protein